MSNLNALFVCITYLAIALVSTFWFSTLNLTPDESTALAALSVFNIGMGVNVVIQAYCMGVRFGWKS